MAKSFDELVMRTTSKAVRARADRRAKELLGEMLLAEIRKAKKVSQSALAKAMGIRQPTLSKLENQQDMQISTLDRLVTALGGTLVISAKFDDQVVTLRNFSPGALSRVADEVTPPAQAPRSGAATKSPKSTRRRLQPA